MKPLGRAEILVMLVVVVMTRVIAISACNIYDDAFITYRYAQNFAAGHGLIYNHGAAWEPILGTTSPGYGILLGSLAMLGLEITHASVGVNILCDLISAWLLLQILDRRRVLGMLVVLGFATFPPLVRITVGGMEAPVACCLMLTATLLAKRQRFAAAGVAAALTCTMRPDAALFVMAMTITCFGKDKANPWRTNLIRYSVPVLVIGAVYAGGLTLVYGNPIPQSILAKSSTNAAKPFAEVSAQVKLQALLPLRVLLPLLPVVGWGLQNSWFTIPSLRPVFLSVFMLLGSFLVARAHTWGWYYYVPLLCWLISLSVGIRRLLQFAVNWRPSWKRVFDYAPIAASVLIMVPVVFFGLRAKDLITTRVYQPMIAMMKDPSLGMTPTSRVLAADIGAIGYFTPCRILDGCGLTWPGALGKSTVELAREHRPEFVMMPAAQDQLGPHVQSDWFMANYEPVRRFNIYNNKKLRPKFEELPNFWVQDYMIYRRRGM